MLKAQYKLKNKEEEFVVCKNFFTSSKKGRCAIKSLKKVASAIFLWRLR